ncbi:MAG: hypothetical protein JNJ89_15035 [Rubrivivax sp.]|nr:hypothetical protein [Rubrivivax sp.]
MKPPPIDRHHPTMDTDLATAIAVTRHSRGRAMALLGRWSAAAAVVLAACAAAPLPAGFTHAGSFQQMMHSGEVGGRVTLAALATPPGTWGVGATAGLKGELLVADGRMLVSPGTAADGAVRAPLPGEQAVLYAAATVKGWAEAAVPADMDQAAFEAFVADQARQRGIDLAQPFVFQVQGSYPQLRWHVVTGEKPAAVGQGGSHGGHGAQVGHANAATGMKVFHNPGRSGLLVGIYSGAALEGVVSHPGERFHVHYASADLGVSGHVDAYAVARGATLKLQIR